MMVDKIYMNKLRESLHEYAFIRREVIRETGDALHHAKRAIFSLQRADQKEAKMKLEEAEVIFEKLHAKYENEIKIKDEGSYKAAVEEYVEAVLFYQFITTGKINEIKTFIIEPEVYLAGLCDVPGELYRYAIKAATNKDIKTVKKCSDAAAEIIGELIEFNLTSYLRTKFDQAKLAAQKLEYAVYEVSLRGK